VVRHRESKGNRATDDGLPRPVFQTGRCILLVITRKIGEEVQVGDATIVVLRAGPRDVRLGITAPHTTKIVRDDAKKDRDGKAVR